MLDGRVVGVHDGDTITLLMEGNHTIKVRLAQIDAPESKQPFGNQSKKSLSDMVFNKTIRVERETIDKYGRTVGTLFVGDLDVNKEQVKRGMAWVYPKYAHDPALFNLEAEARQASLGLWPDPTSMPPWEFRHKGEQGYTPGQTSSVTQTSNSMDRAHVAKSVFVNRWCLVRKPSVI